MQHAIEHHRHGLYVNPSFADFGLSWDSGIRPGARAVMKGRLVGKLQQSPMAPRVRRALCVVVGLFWLPWLFAAAMHRPTSFAEIQPADAALVFGALVRSEAISPLQHERLVAARALWQAGKVRSIVVSNTPAAARLMAVHLRELGVPAHAIEVDGQARLSVDTCLAERARHVSRRALEGRQSGVLAPASRRVVFVSQGYHLPRLAVLCGGVGLRAEGLAAESVAPAREQRASVATLIRVRAWRYTREAALTWLALFRWAAATSAETASRPPTPGSQRQAHW